MQLQVDIEFDQLVKIVKALPARKLQRLKREIEKESVGKKVVPNIKALLLSGPVATVKQLETIENNRKAVNQWRIK